MKDDDTPIVTGVQTGNATLALHLAEAWMDKFHVKRSSENIHGDENSNTKPSPKQLQISSVHLVALKNTHWLGRYQTVQLSSGYSKK